VPAVEDLDHRAARGQLGEDGGDELLLRRLVAHALLDPRGDLRQVRGLVGRLAEGAEDHGGGPHRGDPLTLDVPEDDPDAPRGGDHLVEVTADPRGGGGGHVPDRELRAWHLPGRGAQQDRLRDLRHRPDVGELPFPALAARARHHPHDRHAGDRDERDVPVGLQVKVVVPGKADADGQRQHADERGRDGAPGHRGERRP
jgi:hypothetical protein